MVGRWRLSRTRTSWATVATWSPSSAEHVSDGEPPSTDEVEAAEVVQVPSVGAQPAVEPDRVIEAGAEERSVPPRRRRPDARGSPCRSGGRPTDRRASTGGAAASGRRRIAERLVHLHPGDDATRPVPRPPPTSLGRRRTPCRTWCSRNPTTSIRRRHLRHRDRLYLRRGSAPLERTLGVQDRPDGLTGDDPSGRKTTTVADPIDLISNRLIVIATTDEIRPNGVRLEFAVDGQCRRPQSLRDDLTAVQPSPRILRTGTDVNIGPVG